MPGRLIREGLLDSERYWGCTIEARELFTHIILLADDFGCISMAPSFIGRRCFDQRPTTEKLARLVTQLCDADLLRIYQTNGHSFGFIPRFGQRLRRFTLKHPRPPEVTLFGDERAIKLFSIINAQNQSLPDSSQTLDGHPSSEGKGTEEKGKEKNLKLKSEPEQTHFKTVEIIQGKTYAQWVKDLSITIQPGWTSAEVKLAVEKAIS